MVHTLFERHRALATSDLEQARYEVGKRFCPHRLELRRGGGRLDLVHNARSLGSDVSLNYLRYGDEVRIVPGTFERFFLVQIPLSGRARVRVGDRTVQADRHRGSIGSPTEPVDMVWSAECEKLLVYIRREAVEELVTDADGGPPARPVVFEPMLDLAATAVRDWMQLVHLAVDAVESDSTVLASPLAAGHLEQTIVATLLASQPNSTMDAPASPGASSQTLRRAMQTVQDEPERAWRIAELAERVGVSSRTLQDVFARELGASPLQYLRQVRLERARTDLVVAAKDGGMRHAPSTVTDIAYRWGFFHLSRFAQAYRRTYGELPSQTLSRSPGGYPRRSSSPVASHSSSNERPNVSSTSTPSAPRWNTAASE